MLKRDALKIFDTNILDDYALSVQGSKIRLNEIPNHYRAATHMVLKYGWTGMIGGVCFLFPQYVFYGMIFIIIYIYLFRNAVIGNFYMAISRGRHVNSQTLLKDMIIIILLIIGLFFVGCYIESYISPLILKKIFNIFL